MRHFHSVSPPPASLLPTAPAPQIPVRAPADRSSVAAHTPFPPQLTFCLHEFRLWIAHWSEMMELVGSWLANWSLPQIWKAQRAAGCGQPGLQLSERRRRRAGSGTNHRKTIQPCQILPKPFLIDFDLPELIFSLWKLFNFVLF